MARHGLPAQRDLFTAAWPERRLPQEVRQALLTLVEKLLREIAVDEKGVNREVSDEQDHA